MAALRGAAVAAALAATATVLVVAQIQPPGACSPDYDCKLTHYDMYGNLYELDFTNLCSPIGYTVNDTSGHMYHFNVCGLANQFPCLPKTYTSVFMYGAAMQILDPVRPACNLSDLANECLDPIKNVSRCCTEDCEVLGVGTPIWTFQDSGNPATGGVNLTYTGVPPAADDTHHCDYDYKLGTYRPRSVTFMINCDTSLSNSQLEIDYVGEPSQCNYLIQTRSGAACGCEPDCDGKICGSDGCGGFCSGPNLGGECPYPQLCMDDQTCCTPDCNNRDCGSDGCGGDCGSCGVDEVCNAIQLCVPSDPSNSGMPATAPIVYGASSGGLAGAYIGGVVSSIAVAAAFLFGSGRVDFATLRARGIAGALAQATGSGSGSSALMGEGSASSSGGATSSLKPSRFAGGYGATSS